MNRVWLTFFGKEMGGGGPLILFERITPQLLVFLELRPHVIKT